MKRLFIAALVLLAALAADACTSAIVSGSLTANGRPLLWKNRDTNDQNNRVERIEAHDGLLEFVALFDARDKRDTAAWMGMNERGFAIMNTASYNLNDDSVPESEMDKEGVVMRYALERCTTVDDFEQVLQELPKPLGVEANFGVIDAQGNGAYFETGNYNWTRFDLKDEPSGILTRTNYSVSGREGEGMGYIRHDNEKELLRPYILERNITPATFTEVISRTFYHSRLGKNFNNNGDTWVVDQDFIPRRISTASIVIEGVLSWEHPSLTTMWVAMGYPPCADVMPAWTGENGVPNALQGSGKNNHSAQCDLVNQREAEVFSIKRGNGKYYVNLSKLYNKEGTGYCQVLVPRNMEAYKKGYEEIARRRELLRQSSVRAISHKKR
ncbi:MAG: hypothetical protein IJ808_09690 [Muribaculaceae bacterium]|nr:hypothetical protein [Muribaculaceae bacterium]